MGRSVSVPQDAELVVYTSYDSSDEFAYDDLIGNIRWQLKSKYKSLYNSDRWIGHEDRVLLKNDLVQIGISVYFDVVAIWVVPLDNHPNLAYNFIETIRPTIEKMATLKRKCTMSNGVSVYERVDE